LYFYIASSPKQQSAERHVAPLGHIILISSQPIFALSPKCCVLCGEATHTNFIFLGLTRPGLEPTIYRTRGEHDNHYTTDDVELSKKKDKNTNNGPQNTRYKLKIEQHEPYNKPTLLLDFILLNFIFNLVLAAKGLKLTGHLSLLLSILN
jgi:hypothetical protein